MGRCWSGSVCCLLSPLFDSLLDSVPLFFGGGGLVVYGANVCLVIILIAAEILVAAINIVVDLYAGVE
jgi:hypothetical protein